MDRAAPDRFGTFFQLGNHIVKIDDFLAVHGAASLDDLDERALRDLHGFLYQRVGRAIEDAVDLRKPRLSGKAAELSRLITEVEENMQKRGFRIPSQPL
mgnify:CR=1 FL=1